MLKFSCISYPRRQVLRGDCVAVLLLFLEFLNERDREKLMQHDGRCSLFFSNAVNVEYTLCVSNQVESSQNRFKLAFSFQTALILLALFNSFLPCTLMVVSVVCVVRYLLHH